MRWQTVSVIGAGSWGTALGMLLSDRVEKLLLWGHDPGHIEKMRATGRNDDYLPAAGALPSNFEPTVDLEAAARADLILMVTPSKAVREVSARIATTGIPEGTPLVTCTKGIEAGSGLRMSEIISSALPRNPVAALSGPSHAEEVAQKMPTAIVLGCRDLALAEELQQLFNHPFFRTYTSDDVAGIELGGALKNIFAIAAGIGDGLGLGDNSKAALVTRALAELTRLGCALGGRRETFQGLSGIGDLIVTCFSRHSRNRSVGERLGRGETLEQINASMVMVAEGVPTTRSAQECASHAKIRAPIIEQIHAILYSGQPPRDAMNELLSRDPRPEAG